MAEALISPDPTDEICFDGHDGKATVLLSAADLEAVVRLLEQIKSTGESLILGINLDPKTNTYEWEAGLGNDEAGTGQTPIDAVVDLMSQQ